MCRAHGGSIERVRSAAARRVEMERARSIMVREVAWRQKRLRDAEVDRVVDAARVLGRPVEEVVRTWPTSWVLAVFDAPVLQERHERRLADIEDASRRRARRFVLRPR